MDRYAITVGSDIALAEEEEEEEEEKKEEEGALTSYYIGLSFPSSTKNSTRVLNRLIQVYKDIPFLYRAQKYYRVIALHNCPVNARIYKIITRAVKL